MAKWLAEGLQNLKYFLIYLSALLLLGGCGGEDTNQSLHIGDPAPGFVGIDLNGKSFTLKDFSGEPVIIRFWDTDCKYCKADTPVFNDLHRKFAGKGLHIAYINTLSNLEQVKSFIDALHIEFPVLMDPDGDFAKKWHVITYPSTFIIDTNGQIRYGVNAAIEWDSPEVIETIKSLL